MTATRLQRINYIKSWELDVPQKNLLFPAEKALVDQINKSHNAYFQPFAFPYNDHARYQYYLTFLIEALELLPLKVDLAFDSCWRGYESLLSEKNQCGSDKTKCLQDSCKSYSTREAQLYDNWEAVISRLFSLIPVQTCKYLIQRLFAGHASNAKHGETRINKRVEQNTSFGNVGALMSSVAVKYKAPESSLDELRKASLLLRKAFRGEYITVGSYTGQLDIPDRLYLLVLAGCRKSIF